MVRSVFHLASHRSDVALLLAAAVVFVAASAGQAGQPDQPQDERAQVNRDGADLEPTRRKATRWDTAPGEIDQWVAQLDDDRFDTRQRAQQRLEQAGQPALEAVAAVARAGSLESSTRAINILLKWSEASQQDLRLAALEKLANLSNRPRESAMATRLLAEARELAALGALTKLGARYTRDIHTHGIGNLQVIIGPQWKGGYEGLRHLAEVPRIATISLHTAPLSDPVLDHLAQLPALQRVEVYGTKISPASLERFKLQSPKVNIDERPGGALLGVRGTPQGDIIQVEPDSAAEKAGIVRGDRITEFNGEKVNDFQALTARIGTHRPGDAATLTILRNEKTHQVKVTFDQWGTRNITLSPPPNQLRMQAPQILQPQPPLPQPKIEVERR